MNDVSVTPDCRCCQCARPQEEGAEEVGRATLQTVNARLLSQIKDQVTKLVYVDESYLASPWLFLDTET